MVPDCHIKGVSVPGIQCASVQPPILLIPRSQKNINVNIRFSNHTLVLPEFSGPGREQYLVQIGKYTRLGAMRTKLLLNIYVHLDYIPVLHPGQCIGSQP